MNIDLQRGRVEGAQFSPSPNFDARPKGVPVSLLVVHGISLPPGQFGGPWVEQLFCNCLDLNAHPYFPKIRDLRVSSHLFVRRDASLIQYVSLHDRAWHAGESCFEGQRRCNDFSIGVELEGADDISYEDAQYRSLAALAEALMLAYPDITRERIVGHCHISPGRKTDPGPVFDWEHFNSLIRPAS
ncbi:MAG: 1,6-anhydro-N-acetylmuramyl-L-alanine amidase AmpD [Acidobacteriota bacterium]|nr:1,6-anhydro-N-acetylmuramyl-L-alanine amidase AmpD [Acidobacteriota bacterium]